MNQQKTDEVVAFVPSLFRYVEFLTGSKEIAGIYVRSCLELLSAQPERLCSDDVRLDLFCAFHALWHPTVEQERVEAGVNGRLAMLDPCSVLDRSVVQLAVIEGWPVDRVAKILSIDQFTVSGSLQRARTCMDLPTHQPMLIIEDDALMAKHLNEIAQELGLTLIDVATRSAEAVTMALRHKPAVILADIQLRDGNSGLAAVRAILQCQHLPVVFVTGYPWMLETTDGVYPAIVVAKPFRSEMLKASISLALRLYSDPERAEEHNEMLLAKFQQLQYDQRALN